MAERRVQPRMLCADLVDLRWKDKSGRTKRLVANLEDISLLGACLQVDSPLPVHTTVVIAYPMGELMGRVRYCVYREIGYFLGIEFEPGTKWNQKMFKPQHLLDPRKLVARTNPRSLARLAEATEIGAARAH